MPRRSDGVSWFRFLRLPRYDVAFKVKGLKLFLPQITEGLRRCPKAWQVIKIDRLFQPAVLAKRKGARGLRATKVLTEVFVRNSSAFRCLVPNLVRFTNLPTRGLSDGRYLHYRSGAAED